MSQAESEKADVSIPILRLTTPAVVLLLVTASAVHGFDATGTWTGQFSCKHFNGEKFTFKMKPSTLLISQSGSTVTADIDGFFRYNGAAIDDAKKPNEKGEILLIQCDTDNEAGAGFAEMNRAVVKTKPSKGTGSFSGLSIVEGDFGDGPTFGTCKYKLKRTSTADPNVPACP